MHRVGIDIVSNERVRKHISNSFLRHILSDKELEEYGQRKNSVEYVAGRLAAKEAVLKCLVDKKITDITNISIINGD